MKIQYGCEMREASREQRQIGPSGTAGVVDRSCVRIMNEGMTIPTLTRRINSMRSGAASDSMLGRIRIRISLQRIN